MEENQGINDQDRESSNTSSENQYPSLPPPPSPTHAPGWLTHISPRPLDQFPKAPIPFTFGTDLSISGAPLPDSLRTSSAFTTFLQQHHPAYAAPQDLDRSQGTDYSVASSLHSYVEPQDHANHLQASQFSHVGSSDPGYVGHEAAFRQPSLYPVSAPQPSAVTDSYHPSVSALSWMPSNGHSQLPLFPQDVEYEGEHIQNSSIDANPVEWNGSLNQAFATQPEHRHRLPESNSAIVNGATQDEARSEAQPATVKPKRPRKRVLMDADTADGNAEDTRATQKAKRPRKRRSQAMRNIDPQLMADPLENVDKPVRPRGEPRSRGRPKGMKVGPRPTLDPGPEFITLYNEAMDAFIESDDILRAQTKILQAIAVNPEIFAAHSLLADIHFAKGDPDKGLDALIGGLHAHMNDIELWRQVADMILTIDHGMPQKRVERAMYCFGAILRKDAKDMDARFQRAECARLLGQVNRAFSDLDILLQDDPHNSAVLAQFTKLCQDVNDAPKAKLLYDDHFEYYRVNGTSETDCFTWQDVEIYVNLMAQAGQYAPAVVILKRLSRWLSGRLDEEYWEEYMEDDREFDQNHYPRRLEVPQFDPNRRPEQDYGEALPLDIRAKLGILRLKLGYHEEARSHFEWLEPDLEEEDSLVEEYSDTFLEIAKALYDAQDHREALRFYDALKDTGIDLKFEFWTGFGACAYVCEHRPKAIKAYEKALAINPGSIEARTQLAKLYRDLGDRSNALKYGREAVVMSQDAIPKTTNRKYESKENRLLREAAERALKGAYRLPTGNRRGPGKIPDSLKYRSRRKSRFMRYIPPEESEPEPEPDEDSRRIQDDCVRWPNGRLRKFGPPNRPGRRAKPQMENGREESTNTNEVEVPIEADLDIDTNADASADFDVDIDTEFAAQEDEPRNVSMESETPKKRAYKKRVSRIDYSQRQEDIQALYQNLLKYQSAMREGDEEATSRWVDCAKALVNDFRTVKDFFPGERHQKFKGYDAQPPGRPWPKAKTTAPDSTPLPRQSAEAMDSNVPPSNPDLEASSPVHMVDPGVCNEYCGISFPIWLDIFLELALVIANYPVFQTGDSDIQTDCYTIINAAIDCNVFYHHSPSLSQIYYVYLSCCLALNDDVTLFNTVVRWFMNEFTFCTDTYRLYSTVALLGEYSNIQGKTRIEGSRYRDSSNQKFLFRQLCSIDQQLPKGYGEGTPYGPVPGFMRRERDGLRAPKDKSAKDQSAGKATPRATTTNPRETAGETAEPQTPDPEAVQSAPILRYDRLGNLMGMKHFSPREMDVVLFILYSHIMMANNSFTNALVYLYRAYSLDPTNTVCLLSMALCYLTELFKRQVGNRHALSLMGWMWFGKYETQRRRWAEAIDRENEEDADADGSDIESRKRPKAIDLVNREIEFNRARCWEMLGMPDLAVRGYKKVLALPLPGPKKEIVVNEMTPEEDEDDDPESWDMEAAYAMSTIYMVNGDVKAAKKIVEKYMVVE